MKIERLTLLFLLAGLINSFSSSALVNIKTGNPLLPGYFADPTVKKFGDTYYIYSTTDGVKLASGEPTVWISKDFINWYNYELDLALPEGLNNCWAPDVLQGSDGKYYYFMGNCEMGCNIYGYVSESPMGPFTPINDGKAVIPVGTSKAHLPALDAQYLIDDDGSIYVYFGTWCTSFGGMGYAQIDPNDMFSILKTGFIPINQIPKAFEAAYPIKKDGKYFLMYSSGDCRLSSYAVHYAVSDTQEGPFTPGKNNPILKTNTDGTIDGPGHHSILKEGNDYYILYRRHDNPHSTGGEFRQTCVDKIVFSDSITIEKIIPTHNGINGLGKNQITTPDLAFGAKVSASSHYHLKSKGTVYNPTGYDFQYLPEHVVDNDNGTMWKAANAHQSHSLTIDMGLTHDIKRIATQFEYPSYYYQYKLEVSTDNKHWVLFSNKTTNRRCGSPMIDDNNLKGRYVKLTITGTEMQGTIPAVWNLKVYNTLFDTPPYQNNESSRGPGILNTGSLLVDISAEKFKEGTVVSMVPNRGKLGGNFNAHEKEIEIKSVDGVKSFYFNPGGYLKLSKQTPEKLNWNSPFTASVWVYNPEIGHGECLMSWNTRSNMLQSSYAAVFYGAGNYGAVAHGDAAVDLRFKEVPAKAEWHHIVVTFDGVLENVYVNGILDTQLPISLFVEKGDILIGASGEPSENFSGYIAGVRLYDKAMTESDVLKLMLDTKPRNLSLRIKKH